MQWDLDPEMQAWVKAIETTVLALAAKQVTPTELGRRFHQDC